MGDPARWRGRARSGARSWVAARSYREYAIGLSLAVLVVSGAFGGLARTPQPPPAVAAPGAGVDAAPFVITVERVRVGRDLGVASVAVPEGRYLVVSARVVAHDSTSVSYQTLRDLVRLDGARGLVGAYRQDGDPMEPADEVPPVSIVSTEDAEGLGDLAPDLEYPVAFLFEQAGDAPVPTDVTVVLFAHSYRSSSVEDRFGWFDPAPVVRTTVPVTEYAPAPDPTEGEE